MRSLLYHIVRCCTRAHKLGRRLTGRSYQSVRSARPLNHECRVIEQELSEEFEVIGRKPFDDRAGVSAVPLSFRAGLFSSHVHLMNHPNLQQDRQLYLGSQPRAEPHMCCHGNPYGLAGIFNLAEPYNPHPSPRTYQRVLCVRRA